MQSFAHVEVHRISDHVTVAEVATQIRSYQDQNTVKADAKRLSAFYGHRFYVEVWVRYVFDDGEDYYRAFVFFNGRVSAQVGF